MTDLTCEIAGLALRSPVLAASGCAGTGRELAKFEPLDSFGAVITRSVTLQARAGRPTPRLVETPSGLLNAIGIPGPGIDGFLADELPWLVDHGATVVASIAAGDAADYGRLAQRLRQVRDIAGIEVNLSSPLVPRGRLPFSAEPGPAAAVVQAVRRSTSSSVPVFAKLSGDVGDVVAVGRACVQAGADGLSLINAMRAMSVDVDLTRPALGSGSGGLSGPAIRPVALRAVWETARELPKTPIVASGGIRSGRDALEMLLAGASAVALGSVLIADPSAGRRVSAELAELMDSRGAKSIGELIGLAHLGWEVDS
ncbi:MAG: dihydroorotate dehydrogenase [Candidatus Nanopelagicales bacterium]|nr:dihydroorotate dehydrogenase [Candidatus Nanopelagicales bacterium]MDZ4250823.1 dihydroorotate dehydrogenase [Candidatus Nanopelagicales bacterium]